MSCIYFPVLYSGIPSGGGDFRFSPSVELVRVLPYKYTYVHTLYRTGEFVRLKSWNGCFEQNHFIFSLYTLVHVQCVLPIVNYTYVHTVV